MAADRTPAQTLLAAAEKLREAAKPTDVLEEWAEYYGSESSDVLELDRPWVALMSPALAEPLAAWLEQTAHILEVRGAVEGSKSKAVHPQTILGLGAPDAEWTAALAFARQILGVEAVAVDG